MATPTNILWGACSEHVHACALPNLITYYNFHVFLLFSSLSLSSLSLSLTISLILSPFGLSCSIIKIFGWLHYSNTTLVTWTMSRQASPTPNPPSPTPPVVTAPAVVSSVTIKIPLFWPADPKVWFAQVDAQLTTKSITSQKTRFDHVVASLSPEYATEVRDLILKPPTVDPYTELKKQLIKRTTASEKKRFRQLFSTEELRDRTPSQLLRRMQQLLGTKLLPQNPHS